MELENKKHEINMLSEKVGFLQKEVENYEVTKKEYTFLTGLCP